MRTCGYRVIIIFTKQIQLVMSWVKLHLMDWKSEYYHAYVVIVRWVISEKIPQFTIFLQSTIGCFVNVRMKLLTFQMKSRNLINSEGFSSQPAMYEEVENWKCFENCAPHQGREYLTTISDSLSCAVVISWLDPSIKIIMTICIITTKPGPILFCLTLHFLLVIQDFKI